MVKKRSRDSSLSGHGGSLRGLPNSKLLSKALKPFTEDSLVQLESRTSNVIRDYGFLPRRNPTVPDGSILPLQFEPFPRYMYGVPVEEFDQFIFEETFCVVSKRFRKNYVHRFTASKALFCFSPWNPLRRAAIYISTNQYFDYLVMGTILLNCGFLAMTKTINEAEYIFLAIYTVEMVVKTVAKGFILNKYTYLRNPWNWLDFIVILSGYVTLIIEIGKFNVELGNLAGLRTFRVLRALKTVSIMPGLKTIINALLNSIKQLVEVMTLTVFCLMVFALFALQVYMGVLKNKCVMKMGPENFTDEQFNRWLNNTKHWFLENGTDHPNNGDPVLCGNQSGARSCPDGYTCLPDVGDNPNFGYTSFDNFLWSMLTTFQLITLDYWEDVYNKIIATGGPIQVVFFSIVVFFGSFYLINLMLAVVAMSYEEEAENTEEEKTKEYIDYHSRDGSTFSFDPDKLTHAKPLEKKRTKERRVVVMRKGAAIISDSFASKRKRDSMASVRDGDSSSGLPSARGSARPSSLVVSPPGVIVATPSSPDKRISMFPESRTSPHGQRKPGDGSCDPCTATSKKCCQCQCHARGHGEMGGNAGDRQCDDPRPYLRLANNPTDKQPSLDDSGVVGDHEGDDVITTIQEKPHSKLDTGLYARRKCNGVSPSSPAALSVSSQHIVIYDDDAVDRNCDQCRNCCIHYPSWLKLQGYLYAIVHDACFDLFIMLCIILNTIFLAVEHHGMSFTLNKVLEVGNRVFTAVFTLECILKIMALSKDFFVNKWNVFDMIIVIASLVDLGLEIGSGLSVLRGMRLLRVLKLAQSWRTMRVLLSIIVSTLGALGNLTFVLIIIIYIFAVIGMQLFGKNYVAKNFEPDAVPRWNFTDFFHSFMMIFRILCGEWVEPLWDCMRAAGSEGAETCLMIFLPALVMGNFMILNLFLALLLNSFNSEELKSRQDDLEDESRVIALLSKIKGFLVPKALVKFCSFSDPPNYDDEENGESTADDRILTNKGNIHESPMERTIKQSFSEPEIHIMSQEDNEVEQKKIQPPNPENQGYERMATQISGTNRKKNQVNENFFQKNIELVDSDREGEPLINQREKLIIKRRVKRFKGDDEQPSEIIELSEYKRRQLPEIGVRVRSPKLNPKNPIQITDLRRVRQPSTIERRPTIYERQYEQSSTFRNPSSEYHDPYRSHSPFNSLHLSRISSEYMRNRYTTSRFGGRTNSDPALDSPADILHQNSRSIYDRNYSPIPISQPAFHHRFFPSAPPHATSPDYRMRRSYKGEYTPIYARNYIDYKEDYNLDYKIHPRYSDRFNEKFSDDYGRNYGPMPLDYRERASSFYNRNIRDVFHREYDLRDDIQIRHSRPNLYDKYGSFYKSESDFFPRDYIGEYRNEYNASKIGYTDSTNDTYLNIQSGMSDVYQHSNKYNPRHADISQIASQIPNDYNTSYVPTPVTSKSSYPYPDYPLRGSTYSPDMTDSFAKYGRNTYSPSDKSYSENRLPVSREYREDSVSEMNYSEGYLPKLKINQMTFDETFQGSGDDLPELTLDYPHVKELNTGEDRSQVSEEKNMDTLKVPGSKETPSWGTVANYVDEITTGVKDDDDPRFKATQKKVKEPPNCFPRQLYNRCYCCHLFTKTIMYKKWFELRRICLTVCDSPYFEYFILTLIFASSITLCFEDKHLDSNPDLKMILNYLNLTFAIVFTMEMLVKWIAIGFVKYYSSVWSMLDCFIVVVSLSSLFVEQDNLIALRSLRTLRALRPLRAISRWQGMKIVVNALMYAIPSIFNVLLVCLVFWLIFSIMGVQMFGGKFYKCVDITGDIISSEIVNNKSECLLYDNFTWINSKINFDHVGYAYLALFQVATFEGWMEVMNDAVDCRGIDLQPEREANIYAYIYFVIFIVCGSFFTLNLFIGVIIDNFNALKKKMYEGGVLEMFLTDSQKNYYTAMKKLGRKKPQKVIRRPKYHYHAIFYDIAVSRRFEISIFVLIFLNMVSMAIEHHHQSRTVTFTLEVCNALFTTIFGMEAIVKIIGLRHHYFTVPWNLFDFILVFASILGILLKDVLTNFPISPTLLRVVRVFRIGRILRLIKAAKGIRKLLFALIVSLPALFNIGALLFLITFIYAIIGMAVFGHVQRRGPLDELVNFETFGSSMMLLFRIITSAGWNDVLDPLMVQPPNCDPDYDNQPNGNCGHPVIAIGFFVSFIIINFMIVINMYIAVILENFNQAHKEEEIGIVEDDLEMFYVRWAKYDPHATQFISFVDLSDFIASLEVPFGIPKPNTVALVSFDLPIAKDDKIHCLDILHALTKHVLGHVEETEEFKRFPPQLKLQMEEKFKKQFPTRKELEIVSSTRRWKKMDTAAKIIQRTWKLHQRYKRDSGRKHLLLEEAQTQTSSPGASSIKSGFRKVSNLLQIVPMPMSIRRRSVTVLEVDKENGKSRRGSKVSCGKASPRGSIFFPLSRRASRASISSLISNTSQISVQVHHAIETENKSSKDTYHKPDAS